MFQELKTPTERSEEFKNMTLDSSLRGFHRSPGTNNSVIKGNEKDRLVRCKHCGWICDKERDARTPEESWAFIGINYGSQLTAPTSSLSDARSLSGSGSQAADQYYERSVNGGCPCCGSLIYDQKPSEEQYSMEDMP